MNDQEEVQEALRTYLHIAKADSQTEATALAAMLQQSSSKELIKKVGTLTSSVGNLVKSSNKLYWLSLALTVLTVVLAFCTGALVWLTYKLVFPTGGN